MKMKFIQDFLEWLNPKVVRDTTNDVPWFDPPKIVTPSVEIYKDKKGEWRWRITASNGDIVGASTEGYKTKTACEKNLFLITNLRLKK